MSKPNPKAKKPEIAFAVKKVPGGFTLAKYHIADGKVIKEENTEPDFRDIILEQFTRATSVFWFPEED